jgi:HEAT repeat protein
MSATAHLVRLRRGGRAIRVRVTSLLTRYDLVATAIYARSIGEPEVTRRSCIRYLKRILEEHGVEGFIRIFNNAMPHERKTSDEIIANLFPELNVESPKAAAV